MFRVIKKNFFFLKENKERAIVIIYINEYKLNIMIEDLKVDILQNFII